MSKIILQAATLLFILSCHAQVNQNEKLDPDEFQKQLAADKGNLLDVRTAAEYRTGHIAGALQADWTNRKEFEERIKYIDKTSKVYVYCGVGARSAAVAAWMRNNGFTQVLELSGGIINWQKKGKPTEGTAAIKQMTMEEYKALIPATGIALIDFGAKWCPPCVKMEPVLKEVNETLKNKFTLVRVEAGNHIAIQQSLGIESYPTFIIYKNGKETWRQSGLVEKSVLLDQLEKK